MFVDDIRKRLHPFIGWNDGKDELLYRYANSFRICSKIVSGWKAGEGAGINTTVQDDAWNLFYDFIKNAMKLAVIHESRDLLALGIGPGGATTAEDVAEDGETLVKAFISIFYPGKDLFDEIRTRLNYVLNRASESAWNKNADPYSPMDSIVSFRQMLCDHLEQAAEVNRTLKACSLRDDAVIPIQTQLLETAFEQSRHRPRQPEYMACERIYLSSLAILKKIGKNAVADTPHRFGLDSAWAIRAAMKERIRVAESDPSPEMTVLNWDTVCSIKAAVRGEPQKQGISHSRTRVKSR